MDALQRALVPVSEKVESAEADPAAAERLIRARWRSSATLAGFDEGLSSLCRPIFVYMGIPL
jgi:hypothetical protein